MSSLENDNIYKDLKVPEFEDTEDGENFAETLNKEIAVNIEKMKASRNKQRLNMEAMLDTEAYFCVYFKTKQDKKVFLEKFAILPLGEHFINGYELAKLKNVDMPISETSVKLLTQTKSLRERASNVNKPKAISRSR